uniref:Protein kinase domain-containing protein n=1 Tax=Quercus lobata TaxID=97700 RepID=A0A7N2LJT1_QUELO
MGFLGILVQVTWVAVMLSELAAAAIAFPIALPNCPDKCGDVEIPYPFGLRKGCSIDQNFLINCTNSFGPTQPILLGDLTVTNFSLEGQANILMYMAKDCYKHGVLDSDLSIWTSVYLNSSLNFTISSTQNKFIVVGCDTYAYLDSQQDKGNFSTGCVSVCESSRYIVNGSCSGVGCCEVDIPNGLNYVTLESRSFNNHTKVGAFNPCGYAFISQQTTFNFSIDSLHSLQHQNMTPVVLDWAIGTETCKDIVNKSGYTCGGNSTCIDSDNGSGYRFKCTEGYHGNPYLHLGCQGIGISFIVVLVCSSWLYLIVKKRQLIKLKQRLFEQNGGLILQQKLPKQENSAETTKIFTMKELKKATNNYDETLIIGRGGFGTVYKGILPNNTIVAIKKSKIGDESQIEQFINEVIVLSQINHRNVVKLLGCCLETQVPLLVYEFIPNGTLFEHIHHESKVSTISWETRLRIAAETAKALSYLHSAASPPIFHGDVKSSNILLDSTYTAKVSDFGASKLVPLDQTQLATMVRGTLGYLDPEYMQTSQLTEKSDVYSFGVVLVELLTGKKALSFDRPEEERSLATYFLSFSKDNRLFEVLEKHIANEEYVEQLKEAANLAKMCLRLKGEDRPTMKEVATKLEDLRKMEKHSRENFDSNSEETKFLHTKTSDSDNYDVDNQSADVNDTVRDHVALLDFDDGR